MRTVVVGAGPVGLYSAIVLARAGHEVTIVDRDAGPAPDGTWQRKGVMQFMHPHFFRSIVHDIFVETAPDLWDAVVAAGGVPATPPGAPGFVLNLQCRRWVFETAMRNVAAAEPHVALRTGHADRVEQSGGRVRAVIVDGARVEADLVIDASGRAGRLGDELRAPAEAAACGVAYVARQYRARRAGDGMGVVGLPTYLLADGYLALLFPQDDDTLSTLIVRPEFDRRLAALRDPSAHAAAMRAIPQFADWTDPYRFEPITDVMPGGGLTNSYRGQLGENGAAALPGMFWVGDSMLTTNPAAGRGVSLGLRQAATLVSLLAADTSDPAATAQQLHVWNEQHMRPWFDDHLYWDATLQRRFAGDGIDVNAKIPSDVICAAAEVDPTLLAGVGPYQAMMGLPSVLDPFQERVRDILHTGWRPKPAPLPSRGELADLISDRVVATV